MNNPYEGELVYGSSNGDVVDWLRRYPDWPMSHIIIHGPPKSGKSSFAALFSKALGALLIDGKNKFPKISELIPGPVIVDAAELCAEETLFHLFNHQKSHQFPLVMFTNTDPLLWECETKDFSSRLMTFFSIPIHEPDDLMMGALFFKHMRSQGIDCVESDLDYLQSHAQRDYLAIFSLCERIAEESLRMKKGLTRALMQSAIQDLEKDLRADLDN